MADVEVPQEIPQLVEVPFDGAAYNSHLEQLVANLTLANAAKDSHIVTLRQEITRLNKALGEARDETAKKSQKAQKPGS